MHHKATLSFSVLIVCHKCSLWNCQKYQKLANPNVGGALACLMLMNYLEYFKVLINTLEHNRHDSPPGWQIPESSNPDQTDFDFMYELVTNDITRIYDIASSTRTLVNAPVKPIKCSAESLLQIIEHYNLSQSGKLGTLTILLSFFAPMAAVSVSIPSSKTT